MKLIYDIQDVPTRRTPLKARQWTAIIPAAGRGTRLHTVQPKILYPVLGKPILEWLSNLLEPLCQSLVFVLSPENVSQVKPRLKTQLGPKARVVIQKKPTGMADAIALCKNAVKTPYVLVLWGDQITARTRTLAACMNVLESSSKFQATIPTIERDNPYIHFFRDRSGRIVKVYQARETDRRLPRGENDCGAFLFRTSALFRVLRKTRGDAAHRGAKTKEWNFLSLIPCFHDHQGELATVRIHDARETLGVNTPGDAAQAERILKNRKP